MFWGPKNDTGNGNQLLSIMYVCVSNFQSYYIYTYEVVPMHRAPASPESLKFLIKTLSQIYMLSLDE